MSRWLLSLYLCVAFACTAAAQPHDDLIGLPGTPLLPSEIAARNTNPPAPEDKNVKIGKAIASYLASLIDEGKVDAGAWYSLNGMGAGYMARITTRKWLLAVNNGVESDAPKEHVFKFDDLIGEHVIIKLRRRGETRGNLESSDTEAAVGYRADGGPIPVEFRVEGSIWKDDTASVDVRKYRAVLETSTDDPNATSFIKFRVGLENATINDVSAFRGVAAARLELGNTITKPSGLEVRFYADVEISVGSFVNSTPGQPTGLSRSYEGLAGLMIRNNRAGISLEHSYKEETAGGDRRLIRNVTRIHGYLALDKNNVWQIYGQFGIETIHNRFDPLAPLDLTVRPRGGAGLSIAPWANRLKNSRGPTLNLGTEVRKDLDGRWDNRIMATITIPWDFGF